MAKTKAGPSSTSPVDPRIFEPLYGKQGLLDGDIIAYRCAFVAEHTYYYVRQPDGSGTEFDNAKEANSLAKSSDGSVVWTRKEIQPVEFALQATKTTVEAIFTKSRANGLAIYLSGKGNFRDDIAVTRPYKGGRETLAKPKHWRAVRDYLCQVHKAETIDGYEADDAIGIASTRDRKGTFVCTIDKDLDQLPGTHYNWVQDRVYEVSPRDADYNLYTQILSGDATDNIGGLAGIGGVAAQRILDGARSSRELFERTWGAYLAAFGHDHYAEAWSYFLEQANLVYVLRETIARYSPPYIPEEVL